MFLFCFHEANIEFLDFKIFSQERRPKINIVPKSVIITSYKKGHVKSRIINKLKKTIK